MIVAVLPIKHNDHVTVLLSFHLTVCSIVHCDCSGVVWAPFQCGLTDVNVM